MYLCKVSQLLTGRGGFLTQRSPQHLCSFIKRCLLICNDTLLMCPFSSLSASCSSDSLLSPLFLLVYLPLWPLLPLFFALLELETFPACPRYLTCDLLLFGSVSVLVSLLLLSPCPCSDFVFFATSAQLLRVPLKKLHLSQHILRKCTFPIRPPFNFLSLAPLK